MSTCEDTLNGIALNVLTSNTNTSNILNDLLTVLFNIDTVIDIVNLLENTDLSTVETSLISITDSLTANDTNLLDVQTDLGIIKNAVSLDFAGSKSLFNFLTDNYTDMGIVKTKLDTLVSSNVSEDILLVVNNLLFNFSSIPIQISNLDSKIVTIQNDLIEQSSEISIIKDDLMSLDTKLDFIIDSISNIPQPDMSDLKTDLTLIKTFLGLTT